MKRIATLAVILLMGLTASAHSIRYFTYGQAERTVRYLNAQNEMMIYCGYDYEIETYVLINEVWMERVNSAYYEIWVFGYDAYTGDEVYMPLDLGCVWLFSAGRIYNAAQYLRFHTSARPPHFTWYVPAYNPYTRIMHRPGFRRSYHYDIHRYGWMPPAYTYGPGMPPPPLPYYYMRHPNTPAPRPTHTWTPGAERPQVAAPSTAGRTGTAGRVITGANNSGNGSSGTRTSSASGSNTRGTGTATGTSTGSSRGNSTNSGDRGTSTTTTGSSRGSATSATTGGNSRGTSTSGTTGSSRGSSTNSGDRGTSASGSTGSSRGAATTTGTTPTRGNTNSAASSSSSRGNRSSAAASSNTDKPKTAAASSRGNSTSGSRGTTTGSRGTASSRGNNSSR